MLNEALDKLPSVRNFNKGVDALFFRIDQLWGFKVFHNPKRGQAAYEAQKLAAGEGLAPIVGNATEFDWSASPFILYKKTVFGHLTQCVTRTVFDYLQEQNCMDNDDHWDYLEKNTAYHVLCNGLRRLFPKSHVMDLHSENVGYMSDGNLVCIDFGHIANEN